jgi:RND superfamily putative drug exporter
MSRLLYRIGGACARHPWRVVAAWLAALAAAAAVAAFAGGSLRDQMTVPGTSSDRATRQLVSGFPAEAGAEAHVVARWPSAGADRQDRARTAATQRGIQALPGIRSVQVRTGPDGRTVMLVARYRHELADVDAARATAQLTAAAAPLRQGGAEVAVGGEVPESIQGPNGSAETVGVVAALVVLVLVFGSMLAAGVPLAIAFVGVGTGLSLITLLAAVTDVNTVSPTLGSMIGLGVGIDYALFIVARHRDGLAAGLAPAAAAAEATGTAGKAVVFAGASVLIGITGLAFSGVSSFASMGVAAGLVVLCCVVAAATLVPALLGLLGPRVFGRRARRRGMLPSSSFRSRRAERVARAVVRRPVTALLVSTVALAALAAPALSMRLGQNDAGSESRSNPTRQAYDMVADAFGPGANGPLVVVADRRAAGGVSLDALRADIAATPGVSSVSPALESSDGRTGVLEVVPATGPQDARTYDLVHRLHAQLPPGADVTGPTAATVDLTSVLGGHLWLVVLAVLAATAVLLLILFRSLVLPLKAVVTNLLSVGASYGVMTLAFQTTWGAQLLGLAGPVPVPAWAPMVLFAILFGLSMDYEVFILSRVREQYEQSGDMAESIVGGLASTARIIGSAAAIMIVIALGFSLDPSVMVKIIGVGMASAIFIDVTLSRLLLVPAAMALLGTRNWYLPRWAGRRLPRQRLARRRPGRIRLGT